MCAHVQPGLNGRRVQKREEKLLGCCDLSGLSNVSTQCITIANNIVHIYIYIQVEDINLAINSLDILQHIQCQTGRYISRERVVTWCTEEVGYFFFLSGIRIAGQVMMLPKLEMVQYIRLYISCYYVCLPRKQYVKRASLLATMCVGCQRRCGWSWV